MTETISRNDEVPVIRDADVLVADCGVSGLFKDRTYGGLA
jgi:hypothetical protein